MEILTSAQQGLSGWSTTHGSYASMTTDGRVATITMTPVGGWEVLYLPVTLEVGKTYALSGWWKAGTSPRSMASISSTIQSNENSG